MHFFIFLFVLLLFFLRLASFCSDFTISKIETCKWIKESLWKIREAINEVGVGACSLGLWAGILWRPQKYPIWFKCDIKTRRERYLINNSLQLGLRRYLSTKWIWRKIPPQSFSWQSINTPYFKWWKRKWKVWLSGFSDSKWVLLKLLQHTLRGDKFVRYFLINLSNCTFNSICQV